jgi:type II secretory pathway component PulF
MPGLISGLLFKLPWRRKRMERDFSMVLALLLDAGVPEAEAVRRAGQSTDNTIMLARAERVVARLSSGIKLPDAIREMEDSDEAAWRLTNALRRGTGFMTALNGWPEALSASAFQLEQSAAQLFTTALVLFNGLIVGCVVIGLFEALIQILQGAVLW